MAGSVFAVTAETPVIWLTVLLGIPGIALWIAAYFGYQLTKRHRTAKVLPLIDAKYDEAYAVCEKAQHIIHAFETAVCALHMAVLLLTFNHSQTQFKQITNESVVS